MEEIVAEEKAGEVHASGGDAPKKPILLIVLAIINMIVVVGVGYMLYANKKKEAAEPNKLDAIVEGQHEAHNNEKSNEKSFVGKVVPLETFLINLADSKGRKVAKVNMELELKGDDVADEIDKRKAQIRDLIIIILSSKTFDEVSTREGKENLRNEIKESINLFLTKGQINNVFFTEFIYN